MDLECNSTTDKEKVSTNNHDSLTSRVCIPTHDSRDYISSKSAPYRLIHLKSHLKFVNKHLNECVICKSKEGVEVIEANRIGLASSFMTRCDKCENNYKHAKNQLEYFQNKLDETKRRQKDDSSKKDDDRKLYYSVRYQKNRFKRHLDLLQERQEHQNMVSKKAQKE